MISQSKNLKHLYRYVKNTNKSIETNIFVYNENELIDEPYDICKEFSELFHRNSVTRL